MLGKVIVHFTVTGGRETGVDLVFIQPFLLSYVNHVVLILNSIFAELSRTKRAQQSTTDKKIW